MFDGGDFDGDHHPGEHPVHQAGGIHGEEDCQIMTLGKDQLYDSLVLHNW